MEVAVEAADGGSVVVAMLRWLVMRAGSSSSRLSNMRIEIIKYAFDHCICRMSMMLLVEICKPPPPPPAEVAGVQRPLHFVSRLFIASTFYRGKKSRHKVQGSLNSRYLRRRRKMRKVAK